MVKPEVIELTFSTERVKEILDGLSNLANHIKETTKKVDDLAIILTKLRDEKIL